jgi:antitoxin (DNA-binding transcriptional repressor) of toxin-antitoxin stability system
MVKKYSIAEASNNLTDIVHEAEEGARVELTRGGKPAFKGLENRRLALLNAPETELSTRRDGESTRSRPRGARIAGRGGAVGPRGARMDP